MLNEPTEEVLNRLPRLGETARVPFEKKIIHLHFYIPGQDTPPQEIFGPLAHQPPGSHRIYLLRNSFHWYIAEYDGEDLFYGYANLGDDYMAEWGDISYSELCEPGPYGIEVFNDVFWKPKTFSEAMQEREKKEGRQYRGNEFG